MSRGVGWGSSQRRTNSWLAGDNGSSVVSPILPAEKQQVMEHFFICLGDEDPAHLLTPTLTLHTRITPVFVWEGDETLVIRVHSLTEGGRDPHGVLIGAEGRWGPDPTPRDLAPVRSSIDRPGDGLEKTRSTEPDRPQTPRPVDKARDPGAQPERRERTQTGLAILDRPISNSLHAPGRAS